MAQKQLRPVQPCQARTSLGNVKATRLDGSEYSHSFLSRQSEIDVVGLLSARSGVAPATVRAQFDAWQIGGAHG